MEPPLWSDGASPWPHEREALAFVRARLPNHEPYRAWSSVEFIAEDGSVNQVDLLVVTPQGFFLVEIKSHPGVLLGDGQRWRLRKPNGKRTSMEHPLILTDRKAKRLRSLLSRQPVFQRNQAPWVTPVVFLSSSELECRLRDIGRIGVCGRDPDPVGPGRERSRRPTDSGSMAVPPLPGIVASLKDPSRASLRGRAIDRPLSAKIAAALDQAGLRPSNRGRRVGDWELGEVLDEGPGWQDFPATRPRIDARRRVRIYLAGLATTADEEDRLRRLAEREFRAVHDIRHDGIAQPLELAQAERGPALLFERDEGEERLDLWAPGNIPDLPFEERVEMLRQLTEAIAHAHARRISHRALTARSILVRPVAADWLDEGGRGPDGASAGPVGGWRLVVGHWQAGARELASRLTTHTTSSSSGGLGSTLAERLDATEQVYLAPESFSTEGPDGVALDVFSLGALAFLLLTGRPPAEDLTEREAMLAAHKGLALDSALDSPPDSLAMFVATATDPLPARRAPVRDLLELVDDALDELTRPVPQAVATGEGEAGGTDGSASNEAGAAVAGATTLPTGPPPAELLPTVDPLSAHRNDRLDGGWKVRKRLGTGSTALALLCDREGNTEPEVLKVAKDEEHAERLRDEARVLDQLNHPGHPGIVELLGVEHIGGRTTLRLAPAGDPDDRLGMTLADRLEAHGRIGLDLLERFGDDLLDTLNYLASVGISHRDIKPDNLGVRPRRGDRSLHLVLFDFSLSRTSDTTLGAGTTGYLDPFLVERPGRRWDGAAERYAAAVTLYEMATGTRPQWGDGRTDPLHLDDEVPRIDLDLFDPSVRDGLASFFRKALHRDVASRYDTADEMRLAWRAAFADAHRPTSGDSGGALDPSQLERLATAATRETPVGELGLSGRATSTLERLGLATVGQLIEYPTSEWNRAPGVGLQVRREVADAIVRLREHADLDPGDPAASVDRLAEKLVPRTTPRAAHNAEALRLLLGLDAGATTALPFPADDGRPGDPAATTEARPRQAGTRASPPPGSVELGWPGATDLMGRLQLDRAGYEALMGWARRRWERNSLITQVRNDLHTILHRADGVLPGDELALALLAQRGSTATGPERLRRARAVVRAALEAEAGRESNRFTWRRLAGGASAVVALHDDELDGEALADFAAGLGNVADRLATADPLPTPAAVLGALRAVPTPPGLRPLPDHRLVRLAAASSSTAAMSSRSELYPRGMSAARAVSLARGALLGAGVLSEEDVRTRVRTRFQAAEPLPPRPELDRLLCDTVGLEWTHGGTGPTGAPQRPGYRIPPPAVVACTAFTSVGARRRTGTATDVPEEQRVAADATQDRLSRQAAAGGYLVLTVKPQYQERAITELARLGAAMVDLDEALIKELQRVSEARGISWRDAILAADREGPEGRHWSRLLTVVGEALKPIRDRLLHEHRHLLLTKPGGLARYDELGLLDELRERTRRPEPGQMLHTLWVLVPADDPDALPRVDGRAVPVTSPAERFALPRAWLDNIHQTTDLGDPGGRT